MDMESNKKVLTPLMCESCILRQRKRTSRRKLACCLFIAYNAIILSVISATLWYINDRLNRTERAIVILKEQSETSDENLPIEFPPLVTKRDAEETQLQDISSDRTTSLSMNVNRMIRRKRSQNKKKRKKRCKNCLPVVQIEGSGGFGKKEDKSDLSDLWVTPTWVNPQDKQLARYFDVSSVTGKGKIKVKQDGLYFVYAQMNLIGPSIKGFEVFMEETNSAPVCITSCKRNSFQDQDQTEHCFTMKVVHLKSDSSVYIQEMEANSGSHYIRDSSVFGLVKIGS